MHRLNKHLDKYNFQLLVKAYPNLSKFVFTNKYDTRTIDFSNPKAVLALNKALLIQSYNISHWDIPDGYLCPPVPGRADYIHHLAELLSRKNFGKIPIGTSILGLDIGVGANCIYPIIGNSEYGWSFIGTDIDLTAIDSARNIVKSNPSLVNKVDIRLQNNPNNILLNAIEEKEKVDFTICNPPFHSSEKEAIFATTRKLKNLNLNKDSKPILNFGGKNNELWCNGGELKFVQDMIIQSKKISQSCFWFTTLVSKQNNLKKVNNSLKKVGAVDIITIPMGQGNKTSRVVAWTFLNKKQQSSWREMRWK